MKQTGIIMSGNHPKLILDGTKTMTRRTWGLKEINRNPDEWCFIEEDNIWQFVNQTGSVINIKCPYGQVGSKLWVRETHYRYGHWVKNGLTKTGRQKWLFHADTKKIRFIKPSAGCCSTKTCRGWFKRPSIFMPRWASRITRDITLLRVERLREISEADALAEGGYSVEEFIKLYLTINHLPEDADPWNWVIGW